MQSAASAINWRHLSEPGDRLAAARLQCHHAIQLNTRFARGFATPKEDDSHTSLAWDFKRNALVGVEAATFRLGLRIAELTLILIDAASGAEISTFRLPGQTLDEAAKWLAGWLRDAGLDPEPLAHSIHFELDDHPLLHGAQFEADGHEKPLQELAGWYANAATSLEAIGRPVRCWPHHFDIATQFVDGERTIGAGLSPGDSNMNQPYFYVTLWPESKVNELPALKIGHWNTQEWAGAILTADEILAHTDQGVLVNDFLHQAVELFKSQLP